MSNCTQLKQAISKLSVQEFNDVMDSIEDVSTLNEDVLAWMLSSLESSSMSGSIFEQLSYNHFKDISSHPELLEHLLNYLLILNRLVTVMGNKSHYQIVNKWKIPTFNNILSAQIQDDDCFICLEPTAHQLVDSPCSCNVKIHIQCLNQVINTSGDRCRTCGDSYNSRKRNNSIYYPSILVYPDGEDYAILDPSDYASRFKYALEYLEVEALNSMRDNITYDVLNSYLSNYEDKYDVVNSEFRIKSNSIAVDAQTIASIEDIINSKIQEYAIKLKCKAEPVQEVYVGALRRIGLSSSGPKRGSSKSGPKGHSGRSYWRYDDSSSDTSSSDTSSSDTSSSDTSSSDTSSSDTSSSDTSSSDEECEYSNKYNKRGCYNGKKRNCYNSKKRDYNNDGNYKMRGCC
jgi:hypothetical protein